MWKDSFSTKNVKCKHLGPVVQSIINLTSSLRDQLIKCLTTLYKYTEIFLLKKMREAFALQSCSHFFNKKYWQISDIKVSNFNVTLSKDVVSFEQPGPRML